ncbi:MAG TPA: hypothetical protein VKO84_00050 [Gaiellaceae bacterium]|nr:hypothetical protein [Gaiellaceae bacterium]
MIVLALPPGGDLAAQLYRTELVQHGNLIWDNLWFAGQYPLASYSLLYSPIAAVVGNATLGVAGVVIAAGAFASVAYREWARVGRWPARLFAVLLTGQVFTGAYPYDIGLASLLATVWALQRRRVWLAAPAAVLTMALSPLAFLFLGLALFALFLRRRSLGRQTLLIAGAVALAAGVELAVLTLLPSPGMVYPYGTWRLLAGLGVSGLGVVLSLRGRGGWPLASIFLVWASASLILDLVPSPVGHNLVRADVFVVPLMLVAAARADFRPRWLATVAIGAALVANIGPYLSMIPDRSSSPDAQPAFWAPVIRYLDRHLTAQFRVEVVPTANHWESYYLPRAGIPLARGWYRQLDMADNRTLYAATLTPADYRAWLRRRGVRFVVLPHLPLEPVGVAVDSREAQLVSSQRSGLRPVLRLPSATIFELPNPTPLLTGPGPAVVTELQSSRITAYAGKPGTYFLRVHYSPYWSVTRGAVCPLPGPDAMTWLRVARAGRFSIQAAETPGAVLARVFDDDTRQCRAADVLKLAPSR